MSTANVPRQLLSTTCPLDCPDACKLQVTVEEGRVVKIDGDQDDLVTAGYICGKVRSFADHVYAKERLQTPLRRSGAKGAGIFTPISWDEAYGEIAERITHDRREYGGESILPCCYGGSNGKLTQDAIDARLFYRLEASYLERTVCAAPSGTAYQATYGKMPGVAYQDYANSNYIVIWGNNPHASGIHLVPMIQQAQRRGAKLVVVDPRRTSLAAKADLHLPVRPGTDLVIALAMIRWLDREGYADLSFLAQHTAGYSQLLERAADWTIERAAAVAHVPDGVLLEFFCSYAQADRAVIRCGWGVERNRNGGSAVAAVLAIPAVANKFERSGGFTMSNSGAWRLDNSRLIQASPPSTRRVNMNRLGNALLAYHDPPIKTLFVYNCNPVVTLPEQNKVLQGFAREDLFTVVFDQVMTDTAVWADIVLPATTFLEHDDIRNGYGNTRMGLVRPVVEARGMSKCNNEVFAELLRRLDLAQDDDLLTQRQLGEAILGSTAYAELAKHGELAPACGPCPIQMVDVVPGTPSGKIELFPASLEQASQVGLYRFIEIDDAACKFPLTLISPSTSQMVNSSLGYRVTKPGIAMLHPADAEAREISNGQLIRIFNHRGEVVVEARVDDAVASGVVSLAKGLWRRHTKNGQTANALVPDTLSDIGAGACFNDTRVEVESVRL